MSTALTHSEADQHDLTSQLPATADAASGWRLVALALPAVAALVLWRLSLLYVDVSHLGQYGLPPALPITWYASLVLAILGTVVASTVRASSSLIMVGSVIVVAIILYATVPVLSAQPHYAWVYKHIGVVRYLEAHGKVNPNIDIYNRWPGFFALGAIFSTVGGSPNPEVYAGWAELFFLLLDILLLMVSVRAITRDLRLAVGAALLFVLSNWVGQTYYSPQAFAFVLGLALIVIVLRQLRVTGTSYSRRIMPPDRTRRARTAAIGRPPTTSRNGLAESLSQPSWASMRSSSRAIS